MGQRSPKGSTVFITRRGVGSAYSLFVPIYVTANYSPTRTHRQNETLHETCVLLFVRTYIVIESNVQQIPHEIVPVNVTIHCGCFLLVLLLCIGATIIIANLVRNYDCRPAAKASCGLISVIRDDMEQPPFSDTGWYLLTTLIQWSKTGWQRGALSKSEMGNVRRSRGE